MHVVDHEPHAWFLLGEGDALLLDVNCSHGPAGYDVLIRLTADEASGYAREGRAHVDRLAQAVQNAGPGRGHQLRDVSATHSDEVMAAIREWWATRTDR